MIGTAPEASAHPALQTAHWLARPIGFLEANRRRYGDTYGIKLLGFRRTTVLLSDPEHLRALYTGFQHPLAPGRATTLRPVLGDDSVLLLEGDAHLQRRRLMLPPFHGERMRAYEATVREIAERDMAAWPEGRPFPLHPRMQAITLQVILRAVFGVTDSTRRTELSGLLARLVRGTSSRRAQLRVLRARGGRGGGDPFSRLHEIEREIDALLYAEIAERRNESDPAEREDILSLLVAAEFDDGSRMSDRELRDQLMTLLLAGHETTATALAWAFELLLHNAGPLERLYDELETGDGDAYQRAVVWESLRLRPIVPFAGRRLGADLEAEGLHLPEGTDVTPAIWLTHTRPDLYPEPYEFRPERFLDAPPTTYGWIPFGGGIRRCLGAAFAELEMRVVLETVLLGRDVRPASAKPEVIARRNVTLSPKKGTEVIAGAPRVAARSASATVA